MNCSDNSQDPNRSADLPNTQSAASSCLNRQFCPPSFELQALLDQVNRLKDELARSEAKRQQLEATNQLQETQLKQNLQTLQQTELELRNLTNKLDQRVAERTAELTPILNQLQQDIQACQLVEDQRLQQEQFLRSIYDGVELEIFVIDVTPDSNFRYVGWNQETERVTNIRSDFALGKTPEEVFGWDQGQQVRQHYQSCVDAECSISYEERLIMKTCSSWWLTTLNPLKDAQGNVYRIVGTAFDITERKRQEEALRLIVEGTANKTGDAFFQSCVRYLSEVLKMQCAIIARVDANLTRAQTIAVWTGEAIAENFEYDLRHTPCNQVYSQSIYRVERSVQAQLPNHPILSSMQAESYIGVPIVDAQNNFQGHIAVLDTKPLADHQSTQEMILRIFAARVNAELERQEADAALRTKAAELERAIDDLQRTQAQLVQSEKMSSLGQLVAGIAHEINNPINFIAGNLEHATAYMQDAFQLLRLYRQHYPQPVPAIQSVSQSLDLDFLMTDFLRVLNSIKNGSDRIQTIVESLRNFVRMDEMGLKAVDLHVGLESTLLLLRNRLDHPGSLHTIQIIKTYGDLPLVDCYPGQLNQVFMNILMNAIDALEERAGKRSSADDPPPTEGLPPPTWIAITTTRIADRVQIRIADNGIGMTAATQQNILDPFFTTKPVGKGTGLGLSISYQIVTKNHKGTFAFTSAINQGTEFVIELPIKQISNQISSQ